jgi:hypothetical protein
MTEHKGHHKHHKHPVHKEHHHRKKKQNIWMWISGILLILLVASIVTGGFGLNLFGAKILSKDVAAEKAVNYINNNIMQPGMPTAKILDVEEKNGMYVVGMDIDGRGYESYVTKDGSYLFPSGFRMDEGIEVMRQQQVQQNPPDLENP